MEDNRGWDAEMRQGHPRPEKKMVLMLGPAFPPGSGVSNLPQFIPSRGKSFLLT